MRQSIINALVERPVEFIMLKEIILASDEELKEALKIVRESGKKRTKYRIEILERELGLRTTTKYKCPFETKNEQDNFSREWNKVISMFK